MTEAAPVSAAALTCPQPLALVANREQGLWAVLSCPVSLQMSSQFRQSLLQGCLINNAQVTVPLPTVSFLLLLFPHAF